MSPGGSRPLRIAALPPVRPAAGSCSPAISLGLWHNFGDDRAIDTQRSILRRAFDRGITHFDLANNYGPPYGSAEINFGRLLREDFSSLRDELIISTKAGWDMWPGPYGDLGSRKYLLASLDQSLGRMGLDYVDIFYHHHFDPTPRSKRRWERWTRRALRAKRSTWASRPTPTTHQGSRGDPASSGHPAADSSALVLAASIVGSRTVA